MVDLTGKVAVVTGASQGIGAAIAIGLAAHGAKVVVNHRASPGKADAVVAAIEANGGRAISVRADISRSGGAAQLIEQAVAKFGRLDILVNNAGIYNYQQLADITEDSFHQHFDINVLGTLLAIQAARPHLVKSAGSIINIGSAASRANPATTALYSASKAAMDSLTKTFSKELGPCNVRINTIAPGAVRTEGVTDAGLMGGDWEKLIVAHTPLGRIAETDDITPVVVFLASDGARWITGEILFVAGGC